MNDSVNERGLWLWLRTVSEFLLRLEGTGFVEEMGWDGMGGGGCGGGGMSWKGRGGREGNS